MWGSLRLAPINIVTAWIDTCHASNVTTVIINNFSAIKVLDWESLIAIILTVVVYTAICYGQYFHKRWNINVAWINCGHSGDLWDGAGVEKWILQLHLHLHLANDALQSPANVNCACPGEVLTFICSINGGGNTLDWNCLQLQLEWNSSSPYPVLPTRRNIREL